MQGERGGLFVCPGLMRDSKGLLTGALQIEFNGYTVIYPTFAVPNLFIFINMAKINHIFAVTLVFISY